MNNIGLRTSIEQSLREHLKVARNASFETELYDQLAVKLENFDPSDIGIPEKYISVPILDSLFLSWENKHRRNLYINLLSKLLDKNTQKSIRPIFVYLIDQLSDFDIKLLLELDELIEDYDTRNYPILNLKLLNKKTNGQSIIFNDLTNLSFGPYMKCYNLSIDTFKLLGLISLDYNISFSDKSKYEIIENLEFAKELRKSIAKEDSNELELITEYGTLRTTELFEKFIDVIT